MRIIKKAKITKIRDKIELDFVLIDNISIYILISLITLAINLEWINLLIILINENEVLEFIIKIYKIELNKIF